MKKKIDYDLLEKDGQANAHVMHLKSNLINLNIDENYDYGIKNPINKFLAACLNFFATLVSPIILFVKHGLIIKGRRNLRNIKGGAISISNHILPMDSVMIGQALYPKQVMFHTLEDNMKLPFIRHLIKFLGGMPIPTGIKAKTGYVKATEQFLKKGRIMHIFPEASLWPYYKKIRSFKSGAFHLAVKNNVPIIPISINFRQERGLYKLLTLDDELVTLHIGKPIYPNLDLPFKESVDDLLNKSHKNLYRMNYYFKLLNDNEQLQEQVVEQEIESFK